MLLYEVSSDNFILVPADSNTNRVLNFIKELKPGHVIFSSEQGYYLLTTKEATELLDSEKSISTLIKTLTVTPTKDAFVNADNAPDQCVVTDEDEVIGFFDVTGSLLLENRRSGISHIPDDDKTSSHDLRADFPEKLGEGQTASLMVCLSKIFEDDGGLELSLQSGQIVDIIVRVRGSLTLEGTGEVSLTVTDEDETAPVQFKLTGKKQGTARINIFAFCKGQSLGKISLSPLVTDTKDVLRGEVSQKLAITYPQQADLTLLIDESGDTLSFRLYAPDPNLGCNFTRYNIDLKTDPIHYFQEFFKDIEKLPLLTQKEREIAEFRLERKGSLLFEQLIPDELKSVLWSLKERIQSVQVLSEESWIPWELCKLQGNNGNEITEGPFFCEAFAITRSFPGVPRNPKLSLNNIGLIVPKDSGLTMAHDEKAFVKSLAGSTRKVSLIPAETLSVAKAMQSGEYDCLHFSGHGIAHHSKPDNSRIILENEEVMSPEDVSGTVMNLGKAKPLVFLNACQTGQGAFSLTHVGGWASRFIGAKSAAFIGTYWSVYDKSAFGFSKAFYEGLLSGLPIGEATRKARLSIKRAGDPTWLAYTVFGDPVAEIEK